MSRPLDMLEYLVCGQKIQLQVPAQPDQVLSDAVEGISKDPYWGKVWDSAPHSAACVMRTRWADNTRAIEFGCGCGLLGIAAMLAGLEVTVSDHDDEAVELAIANACLNGFDDARGIVLDWNDPPKQQFDVLLANDVLYEEQFHQPLLDAAAQLVTDTGSFRIGDPGRQLARSFLKLSHDNGWNIEIFDADLRPVLLPSTNEFQWLVLSR